MGAAGISRGVEFPDLLPVGAILSYAELLAYAWGDAAVVRVIRTNRGLPSSSSMPGCVPGGYVGRTADPYRYGVDPRRYVVVDPVAVRDYATARREAFVLSDQPVAWPDAVYLPTRLWPR